MIEIQTFLSQLNRMSEGYLPIEETEPHDICTFEEENGNIWTQENPTLIVDRHGREVRGSAQFFVRPQYGIRVCICTLPLLNNWAIETIPDTTLPSETVPSIVHETELSEIVSKSIEIGQGRVRPILLGVQ